MQKITPCLWFDDRAEEAVQFYASVFKDANIGKTLRYDKASSEVSGRPEGSVMTIEFQILGMQFTALNGGPIFKFTEAISLAIGCDSQEEIDYYWSRLGEGGEEGPCGWLKDKFGLSWQVVPRELSRLLEDPDKETSAKAMKAMLQMKKLDIGELRRAAGK